MRLRVSSRQQLLRFEYLDPRFVRYNKTKFAPLALSVEYNRDSTITRFFRSAIDRGTMGIVQRLDEKGNPIDIFGVSRMMRNPAARGRFVAITRWMPRAAVFSVLITPWLYGRWVAMFRLIASKLPTVAITN